LTKRAAAIAAINLKISRKENTRMKIKTNVRAGGSVGDIRVGNNG
jgi:hypothetical protein